MGVPAYENTSESETDNSPSTSTSCNSSLGPFCDQLGLRNTSTFLKDLERVDVHKLQNGHLVELFIHIRSSRIPWAQVQQALIVGSSEDWSGIPRWVLPKAFSGLYYVTLVCSEYNTVVFLVCCC